MRNNEQIVMDLIVRLIEWALGVEMTLYHGVMV